VAVIEPAVRLDRFDRTRELPELRERLGGGPGCALGGVVSRIQARRRYDLILEALRRALLRAPRLRLALVGRGTRAREVGEEAARRIGVADAVTLPGYFLGDEYVGALRALDFLVYLVPGTDGTCRTVREALATGVPAIVSRRGLLPELVRDGETGLVVDEEPGALAAAMARLAEDEGLRRRMGASAALDARRRFAAEPAAAALAALYARV
jgi:glycosyltransferase involved in cell wall biosynthesis